MVEPLGALAGYIVASRTRCGSSYLVNGVRSWYLFLREDAHLSWVVLPLLETMGFIVEQLRSPSAVDVCCVDSWVAVRTRISGESAFRQNS